MIANKYPFQWFFKTLGASISCAVIVLLIMLVALLIDRIKRKPVNIIEAIQKSMVFGIPFIIFFFLTLDTLSTASRRTHEKYSWIAYESDYRKEWDEVQKKNREIKNEYGYGMVRLRGPNFYLRLAKGWPHGKIITWANVIFGTEPKNEKE